MGTWVLINAGWYNTIFLSGSGRSAPGPDTDFVDYSALPEELKRTLGSGAKIHFQRNSEHQPLARKGQARI